MNGAKVHIYNFILWNALSAFFVDIEVNTFSSIDATQSRTGFSSVLHPRHVGELRIASISEKNKRIILIHSIERLLSFVAHKFNFCEAKRTRIFCCTVYKKRRKKNEWTTSQFMNNWILTQSVPAGRCAISRVFFPWVCCCNFVGRLHYLISAPASQITNWTKATKKKTNYILTEN